MNFGLKTVNNYNCIEMMTILVNVSTKQNKTQGSYQ